MKRTILAICAVVLAVGLIGTASAGGGKLTLRSLDRRMRALTALVLLDERNPPSFQTESEYQPLTQDPNNPRFYRGDVNCSMPDEVVVGGGADLANAPGGSGILSSFPVTLTGWRVVAYVAPNQYATNVSVTAYAVCAKLDTP